MLLRPAEVFSNPGRRLLIACAIFLFLLGFAVYRSKSGAFIDDHIATLPKFKDPPEFGKKPVDDTFTLPLPDGYHANVPAHQSDFCADCFSPKYLTDLRGRSIQYCETASTSALTCFHAHTRQDGADSLCIGEGATLANNRWTLACDVRQPTANESAEGLIPFAQIRGSWYNTGPRYIFDNFVTMEKRSEPAADEPVISGDGDVATDKRADEPRYFSILIKREEASNPWHCLMEIWSMTLTLDVLRMTRNPADAYRPFFDPARDKANTHVLILDDWKDGPYFDLWTLFAESPVVRLKELDGYPELERLLTTKKQQIIMPLPGGSNTFWQNDWDERDCTHSELLEVFVKRIMGHYGVPNSPKVEHTAGERKVRLTFIDRAKTRRLGNQKAMLDELAERYPNVEVESIDFAAIPFSEQIRIARRTDVLVGVHGAGLTISMFLRSGPRAIVEIQPSNMGSPYMGFRNIAIMKDIAYYMGTASPHVESSQSPPQNKARDTGSRASAPRVKVVNVAPKGRKSKRADWHRQDFDIDQNSFIELVGEAIISVQ